MEKQVLFIHTSQENNDMQLRYMPIGLITMANYLKDNNISSRIINTFLEKELNMKFSVNDYIKKNNVDIVCLSLHWHYQTTAVIDLAKKIKEENQDVKIVIGGLSASSFSKEILKEYSWIDYVIKGEGEKPLLELIKILREEKNIDGVPNISYRKGKKIIENKISFVCDKDFLDNLRYTDTSLLEHENRYYKMNLSEGDKAEWMFVFNAGRGCSVNCSFCGGSCDSLKKINNRKEHVFLSYEKVLEELENLSKRGLGRWYTSFDPEPQGKYYSELFRKIRNKGIKMHCKFESWSLPTKEFIDEFKLTFDKDSVIVLSPETGSEEVRDKNKGFSYSNQDLLNFLKYLHLQDIYCTLFFTAGLAFERREDILKTLTLVNFIRKKFPNVKVICVPIEIEPAAPYFLNNKKYGISTKRKKIKDFYEVHKNKSTIGYSTEHFTEEEIPYLSSLVNAMSMCRFEKPLFFQAMIDFMFELENVDFTKQHKLCKGCKHYEECF